MKTNQQLKEELFPRFDWRTYIKFTGEGEIPRKDVEALDEYFKHFVPISPCIKCGHQQGSDHSNPMAIYMPRGRFRLGIQHGEGTCSTGGCGWPARAVHYNVGPIKKLELILQYHPDVVTFVEG